MIINGRWMTTLDGILSPEICHDMIEYVNKQTLEHVDRADMASYDRHTMINTELADKLYELIKPHLPSNIPTIRCNEYFRFSKYKPGEEFKIHRDGVNQDKFGNRTKFTVNIFLNSEFEGGETDFYDEDRNRVFRAVPLAGRGAIFDRDILHCGCKVSNGYKYLIRTDVMIADR